MAEIDGMDNGDPMPAEATTPEVVAELDEASKVFGSGELEVVALHPGDLVLRAGELVLIAGPSGSGKTTVLSLLGCVLSPTTGRVRIRGEDVSGLSSKELAALRLDCVGFVFQEFNLVEPLPAGENVALPLLLAGLPRAQRKKRAREALAVLGLADRVDSYPRALSGGQKQRVAIARALVTDPLLVLCDEPTAALDHASSDVVMDKLLSLARQGRAVAVVSHDLRLTAWADRVVEMIDGRITGERPGEAPHVPKEGLAATRSGR